ncbi:MAG: hypothetical protein JJ934_07510 [Pseudomonadales bacterium]|nr:hypothetical protein [Pseudomonadales bacterium]MBO6595858.1 hypothetical protein [Pseudomonadales bacterium]MBO6656723.1 hypothetical protein [Pseudomonadales bacterium]MBO6822342.1 hypothetical protein [Pseudomonadales bacterium]
MSVKPTYTSPMDAATYAELGLDQTAPWEVNGHDRYGGLKAASGEFDQGYKPCAEAFPNDDVAAGNVTSIKGWSEALAYPNTIRDLRFYTSPGMAQGAQDVSLMIFNDGIGYLGRNGSVRAGQVLDSLFAAGEIAPTLAIFIDPGRPRDIPEFSDPSALTQEQRNRVDDARSIEYDSMTADYGRFLLDEILPLAQSATNCVVTNDAAKKLVAGISSGGIAAFTSAWHFPDEFGLVLSHCGSFTNIKGGHNYAYMVRTTPRKPIRVFMQSGANDIDGIFGNWPIANQMLAQSLEYSGYDYRFEFGAGGHTLAHGGALFAESIRWLLRQRFQQGQ